MDITNEVLMENLLELSQSAANILCDVWNNTSDTNMIFPDKTDKQDYKGKQMLRVSEQELRLACINVIETHSNNLSDFYYGVEVPTTENYSQKGNYELSARSDMSLFEKAPDNYIKLCNIEFKAHNAPEDSIYKDMEKLIKEGLPGGWFHILRNHDSGTLKTLFDKFSRAISKLVDTNEIKLVPKAPIIFTFYILEKDLFIARKVQPDELRRPDHTFIIDYNALISGKYAGSPDGEWRVWDWSKTRHLSLKPSNKKNHA